MSEKCFFCGNTNEDELKYKKQIFDDGEKEIKKYLWVCSDDDECGMRIYQS